MSINSVTISGNIGHDPELRHTASGSAVLGFSVAVNERVKDRETGEWSDKANWVDCVMFGNRAQSLAPYLCKGSKVAIEGKLRWSQWQAQDGSKRSKVEIVVDEIEFMSTRDQAPQQQAPAPAMRPAPSYSQQRMAGTPQPKAPSLYDEDLPF